jgi:hypothetical protein
VVDEVKNQDNEKTDSLASTNNLAPLASYKDCQGVASASAPRLPDINAHNNQPSQRLLRGLNRDVG